MKFASRNSWKLCYDDRQTVILFPGSMFHYFCHTVQMIVMNAIRLRALRLNCARWMDRSSELSERHTIWHADITQMCNVNSSDSFVRLNQRPGLRGFWCVAHSCRTTVLPSLALPTLQYPLQLHNYRRFGLPVRWIRRKRPGCPRPGHSIGMTLSF